MHNFFLTHFHTPTLIEIAASHVEARPTSNHSQPRAPFPPLPPPGVQDIIFHSHPPAPFPWFSALEHITFAAAAAAAGGTTARCAYKIGSPYPFTVEGQLALGLLCAHVCLLTYQPRLGTRVISQFFTGGHFWR